MSLLQKVEKYNSKAYNRCYKNVIKIVSCNKIHNAYHPTLPVNLHAMQPKSIGSHLPSLSCLKRPFCSPTECRVFPRRDTAPLTIISTHAYFFFSPQLSYIQQCINVTYLFMLAMEYNHGLVEHS